MQQITVEPVSNLFYNRTNVHHTWYGTVLVLKLRRVTLEPSVPAFAPQQWRTQDYRLSGGPRQVPVHRPHIPACLPTYSVTRATYTHAWNNSVFSFLPQLLTWHCSYLLLSASHAAIGRYHQQTCSSGVRLANDGTDGQTDGRPTVYISFHMLSAVSVTSRWRYGSEIIHKSNSEVKSFENFLRNFLVSRVWRAAILSPI